jgi:hypothetical protein
MSSSPIRPALERRRQRVSVAKIAATIDDGLLGHLRAAKTTLALELSQRVVVLD